MCVAIEPDATSRTKTYNAFPFQSPLASKALKCANAGNRKACRTTLARDGRTPCRGRITSRSATLFVGRSRLAAHRHRRIPDRSLWLGKAARKVRDQHTPGVSADLDRDGRHGLVTLPARSGSADAQGDFARPAALCRCPLDHEYHCLCIMVLEA